MTSDVTDAETIVARRARLMREEVSEIAIRLFLARGFDGVSVDDIAAAANMSQRTFFRYFATKDEIVLQYERQLRRRLHDAVRLRPADEGPVKALTNAFIETSTAPADRREKARERGRLLNDAPMLQARVRVVLAEADAELAELLTLRMTLLPRRIREDRSRVIVVALVAVAAHAWNEWVTSDSKKDPATYLERAFHVLATGWDQLDEGNSNA
ncbi:TetR family transcriptional regulator [Mycolicibacterium hodleri]|uniref:TetR family transcriptional regulator n=1 Tax=Mycolicibacterium hodleri TaxID=49897 RepID=A0A502EHB4_9MYCO|nr:TetR family transcriptional regulator [Mycolicibacterium hodleri]TPG36449.1 TetR family transcriptional regulator [Mycolicibacterium hodleri]